jgi:hypothetical protein
MSDSGKSGTYTTGLPGLDNVLHGILPGDNLVWDVEYIEDYRSFVLPFAAAAAEKGKRTVYFRFAEHPPLLEQSASVDVVELDPERGFEHFVSDLMDVIEATAADAWYVFDCLSGLAKDWYADRMMANFFLVVCPYVLELKSLAFFAIYKHRHSNHATDTIYSTAQLILEVWVKNGKTYVQPQKVEGRMSATMYMLHAREGDSFTPITNSALTADVVASVKRPLLNFTIQRLGVWTETYRETETIMAALERGEPKESERDALFERLLRMCITRQTSFLPWPGVLRPSVPHRYPQAAHRLRIDRRQGAGNSPGEPDPPGGRPFVGTDPGAPRFLLHRLRRLLHLCDPERLLVAAAQEGQHRRDPPPGGHGQGAAPEG